MHRGVGSSKFSCLLATVIAVLLCLRSADGKRYEPTWDSLDSRPLPHWYDEAKIGIFVHWGVFSVPSYSDTKWDTAWFWYSWIHRKSPGTVKFMQDNYRPGFTYADFAPMFTGELFDPQEWARIFESSGANYVVYVSKHHEGFTNWPSKYSYNWNSMDVGPKRDIVRELADAVRAKTKLRFGVYHSLLEWFHPLYLRDQANGFRTQDFVREKTMPELYELVTKYKPDVVWSDGNWVASDEYWNSTHFLAWLYNDSPVKDYVVVNDRWGNNTECKHGGFWDCNDNFTPSKPPSHKWEDCMPIDRESWGFKRNTEFADLMSMEEIITQMVQTISLGGNLLVNIGPTKYGKIPLYFEERLRKMGDWLKVNGEAIYKTHMWTHQNDSVAPNVYYTAKTQTTGNINYDNHHSSTTVYAILLKWPEKDQLILGRPEVTKDTKVTMLGYSSDPFAIKPAPSGGATITLPAIPPSRMPCQWGWVLKITGLKNAQTIWRPDMFSRRPTRTPLMMGGPPGVQ